jgi:predicted DNA-binding transcriptional regulator YafY
MSQPKLERMLRLMVMLTGNSSLTLKQIAVGFDVTTETIRRYIDTFRDAGFVIKKNKSIFCIDTFSPWFKEISELVHFSEEEAWILKNAIDSIDENNLIKQNLKKKLYTIYQYKILAELTVNPKNASNVNTLADAISGKQQAILHNYASANSGVVRSRLVEPFAFTTNYMDVWCYEPESGENKLFKIARIGKAQMLEHDWLFESEHEAGFIDIFRMHSHRKFSVRLKLNIRAKSLLTEEYPLSEKYLSPIDAQYWLLDIEVCSLAGVGRFVLGLMNDIEVIASKELVKYLKQEIKISQKKLKN